MAQTPQQRKANERFARFEAARRGKPENEIKARTKTKDAKSPISKTWVVILGFVLIGGVIFELLRLFF